MGRLTQKDEQGNWCIQGLPWRDIYLGAVITRNTYERIYGVSNKLLDYEDTGLTSDEINTLRERDTAKAPEEFDGYWFKCPSCGNYAGGLRGNFCHVCGQRLKWEGVRE